jgi:hypothetical protein
MTQYFEGRRGRFWQVPPNGSLAAQWACPVAEAVGLAEPAEDLGRPAPFLEELADLDGLAALLDRPDLAALRGALVAGDGLPAFLADFLDAALLVLGGLMRTCRAIPARP